MAFLHPNIEVEMYFEWPEGIVVLGIISKEFLREYFILLGIPLDFMTLLFVGIQTFLWMLENLRHPREQ